MVTRKEDTPQRVANRKYEEKNREKRQAEKRRYSAKSGKSEIRREKQRKASSSER